MIYMLKCYVYSPNQKIEPILSRLHSTYSSSYKCKSTCLVEFCSKVHISLVAAWAHDSCERGELTQPQSAGIQRPRPFMWELIKLDFPKRRSISQWSSLLLWSCLHFLCRLVRPSGCTKSTSVGKISREHAAKGTSILVSFQPLSGCRRVAIQTFRNRFSHTFCKCLLTVS